MSIPREAVEATKALWPEFEQEAEKLFECVSNNFGWMPIAESLAQAYAQGLNAALPHLLAAKDAQIAALQCDLRLAISARDYANDMLDKERARIAALREAMCRITTAARKDTSLWSKADPLLEFIVAQVDAALEMSGGVK